LTVRPLVDHQAPHTLQMPRALAPLIGGDRCCCRVYRLQRVFKYVDMVLNCIRVIQTAKSSEVISARLSKGRLKIVEEIARKERIDKSTVLDRALEEYAREWKLRRAVEAYGDGSITLSRAAEMAEISIWEMIDVLGKKKVQLQYDVEDLEEDLKAASRD